MVELFAANLRRLNDALEQTELQGHYWVWGGLLLGWAREGAIMRHDCLDADFGILDEDFGRLVAATPALNRAGFSCYQRFQNNSGELTEVTFIRHGARFEFFRMFPNAGELRYFMYDHVDGEALEVEASMPDQDTAVFSFASRDWLKHKDHELELRSIYGAWQIPDPSWSYLNGLDVRERREWQPTDIDWRTGGFGEVASP